MQKRFIIVSMLFFFLMITAACSNDEGKDKASDKQDKVELTISAAASLKDAMDVIQHLYQEEHPEVTLKFNFGGSGSLQRQISQGAPVDLFFSAAEDKFDSLVKEGIIAKEDDVDLLGNTLVLVVQKEASLIENFTDLSKAEVGKISIATPETAPAGNYAKESLEQMGIWKDIESKVVFAKDVRQVLSYVETGNVDAGMVYKTDALASKKVKMVTAAEPATHTHIIYPVGVIKESKHYKAAKELYAYLQKDEALKVFEDYGFSAR